MNTDPEELKDIVERAIQGDTQAFGILYDLYLTPLYRYVYFRIGDGDETEDIVQDVFIKAYRSFGRYSYKGTSPLAYFYTIARNTVIDYRRKKKVPTTSEEEAEHAKDESENPEEEAVKNENASILYKKLSFLPEDQQEVLIFRFIDDLSTKEIAALQGKSEEAVRKFQSRALESLRNIFNQ